MYFEANLKWQRKIAVRDGAASKVLTDEIAVFLHGLGLRDIQSTADAVSFRHIPRVTLIHRWINPSLFLPPKDQPRADPFEGADRGTISVEPSGEWMIIGFDVHVCDVFTAVDYYTGSFRVSGMILIVIISGLVLLGAHIDLWIRLVFVAILVMLRSLATRLLLYISITTTINILAQRLRKFHARAPGS